MRWARERWAMDDRKPGESGNDPVPPLTGGSIGKNMPAASFTGVEPDPEQMKIFLETVYGRWAGLIPLRGIPERERGSKPRNIWIPADDTALGNLADFARWAHGEGAAVFAVPGTVTRRGEAKAAEVVRMQTVLADLDTGDIEAKYAYLVCHLGAPTLEVASGGVTPDGQRKRHLYWRLSEPVEGKDIALLCRLRQEIALKAGADAHFGSAHQPIRVAGSVHHKNGGQRLARIDRHDPRMEIDLEEFAGRAANMAPMPGLDIQDAAAHAGRRGQLTGLFGRRIREGSVDGISRYEAVSRVIGYWIRRERQGHVTPDQAWQEIRDYNTACMAPPWPEERLAAETENIRKRDRSRNGAAGDGDANRVGEDGLDDGVILPVAFSEDALANTFAERHSAAWRHVAAWGQWLKWNGRVWRRENTLEARDLARGICRKAAGSAESARLKARLSSAAVITAVERMARWDRRHAATEEVWDNNPWLLNTPAGVIDLQTGACLPHAPGLYMTRIAGASPGGDCPVWRSFLETVTGGDAGLQSYLQRMAGYCLTGITREHALFFLHGSGANGKSIFVNTLSAILGDYATVAPMDMFMASHGEQHPTGMAGLRGARIVTATETEQGSRWSESKLKALTGGDRIPARFMRQDYFLFTPQFKLLIVGNHKPSIRNVDEAMKRRLHTAPFTITIPPDARDGKLQEKLLAERNGILAWALEGCLDWQRTGLRPPPAVMAATGDYFEAEDAIGRWIGERCSHGTHLSAPVSMMYADWKEWSESNGEFTGSLKRFSENLSGRGFERHNTNAARGFRGITLRGIARLPGGQEK
jgi:putative DNA primase/helicase